MISLGIDVGGSSVKLAATANGQVLWTAHSESYSRATKDQLVDAIQRAAAGRTKNVSSVGICVPGRLDRVRRMITLSVNLPSLNGLRLDDLVGDSVGDSDHIELLNDSTSSAYDIYASHQLSGRLLSITLGTGVGASVLDDGVPLMIEGDSPGHIGQVDVSVPGEDVIGPDGGFGSLEGYIGAPALAKRYGSDMAATLARLTEQDAPIKALARAIRIFHAIYRPQHVYFTGGIGIRLKHLVPSIRKLVNTNLTSVADPKWTISTGDDDFHAAKGAARLAAAAQRPTITSAAAAV
ncbi:MAG TPA: ROK family protein [Tepidisphaeraceae bacterium]|nr:ROK family protein [Tepidisphaeraceae bacterium]